MNKLFRFLVAALFLGVAASNGYALHISSGGQRGDSQVITTTVFNDSGSTLTSGTVVVWDVDAADPAAEGRGSYVTTSTSADSNLVAGVVYSDSIVNQGEGIITIYGPAYALYANSTDGSTDTAGTAIGTTTVAGQFGNGTGLGAILHAPTAGDTGDGVRVLIFVNPSNGE